MQGPHTPSLQQFEQPSTLLHGQQSGFLLLVSPEMQNGAVFPPTHMLPDDGGQVPAH